LGGLFLSLAALAKQLRSTTMRLFGRLASDKNRLAESDHLLFAHSKGNDGGDHQSLLPVVFFLTEDLKITISYPIAHFT
jgi:hypothetical protein